jgi:hypothetical protein
MLRGLFCFAALLTAASSAQASLHQYICNDQFSNSKITLIGSGLFEVSDVPVNGVQYPAIVPLQITVDSMSGTMPFDLRRASTLDNQISLIFGSEGGYKLFMTFDVAGIVKGDPLPSSWGDDDGIVFWNTNSGLLNPGGDPLRGSKNAIVAAVPEPSAVAFGLLVVGLVGSGQVARRLLVRTRRTPDSESLSY